VKQIRKRLTYANVMSTIAVFLVLGGATALAASQLGKNSVGTRQLKKSSVTAAKIKKNAVTPGKIKNNAVTGAKAKESTFGQVPQAAHAVEADTAAPRAYARVLNNAGGLGVDESKSKGISDAGVTLVGGSVYCFELGFTPTNVQATVDWINGGAKTVAQADIGKFVQCPEGSDASVRTTEIEFVEEIIEGVLHKEVKGRGIDNVNFFVSFVG
jgi:hypothetical protein